MIEYHVFPEGRRRIVTFSFDDGHKNDERLVALFQKYQIKATFHLNGKKADDEQITAWKKLYKGHEIACHTVSHGWPTGMPTQAVIKETVENRMFLENISDMPVNGMSYPSGLYNDSVKQAMKMCGIVYARTTKNTMHFSLPGDFMEWHPTCHYKGASECCDFFLKHLDVRFSEPLFYIWGHSHEFTTEEEWQNFEQVLQKLSGNDKIWYATNMDIYQYITAQKSVLISADEKCFYNPTAIDVWLEKDKKEIIYVPAGKVVKV